jgi:predicted DNA-binding transcriptional regulator AlpA
MAWSRGTLYNRIAAKEFPPGIRIGRRMVAWLPSDVDAYVASKVIERAASTARADSTRSTRVPHDN